MVKITVNADGRPTAVSLAKSSGFPRLDRAAVESAWRCRVGNATAGAQLTAPIRFNLER
jgi:TonB family protein